MTSAPASPVPGLWRFLVDNSLLLVMGALTGLLWANLSPASYETLTDQLLFVVNDVGMVFFFAIATKDIVDATRPGGPLASPRRAAVPVWAAAGGMIGPALLYVALNSWAGEPALRGGWAIPCATDIAFSYLAAQFIFRRGHPVLPFLLLLAIADDALGLAILALAYPSATIRPGEFVAFLTAALAVAWLLNRLRVMSVSPYLLVAGLLSWLAFFRGGLHPALALVPIIPFLPQGARGGPHASNDPLSQFARWWHTPVQLILFFFGLVNAGVPLTGAGVGTWIVLASLLAGKPIGILLSVATAQWVGLHRPPGVSWRDMLVLGVTAGIGFTIALFFAAAAFPSGRLLGETKMGALMSISAAALAIVLARALEVGRFRRPALR